MSLKLGYKVHLEYRDIDDVVLTRQQKFLGDQSLVRCFKGETQALSKVFFTPIRCLNLSTSVLCLLPPITPTGTLAVVRASASPQPGLSSVCYSRAVTFISPAPV